MSDMAGRQRAYEDAKASQCDRLAATHWDGCPCVMERTRREARLEALREARVAVAQSFPLDR